MREINIISETHIGDCVFLTDFLNKVVLMDDEIKFNFFIFDKHYEQISALIENSNKVIPLKYSSAPSNCIRAWLAQYGQITRIPFDFNQLKLDFYSTFCNHYKLPNPYKTKEDLILKCSKIKPLKEQKFYDILLVNSDPLSNQLKGQPFNCSKFIEKFSDKKIITTKKIPNIDCTLDFNWQLLEIGCISLSCDKIVGVHTGPWHITMNYDNFLNKKQFYYVDNNCFYTYSNMKQISSLDSLI